jgi:hypothetical protein
MPNASATTASTQQAEGIAACWMGAAESARHAAEGAVPLLRDALGTLIQREEELSEAAATGDPAAFAPAFDRLLRAMEPVVAPVALEQPLTDAKSELARCRSDVDDAGESVDPCWKEVASAYGAAATAAENAIQRGGAQVMLAVQKMIEAGEIGNVEGITKAAEDLSAGMESLERLAAQHATQLGDAKRLAEDCQG